MIAISKSKLLLVGSGVVSAAAIILAAWRLISMQAPGPAPSAPQPPAAIGSQSQVTPTQAPGAAQKSPASSQGANAPSVDPAAAGKPSFDVVRVEPSGETVVAGRAAPKARVALLASGKPIAEADADSDGHFVILPPSLAPGDHMLALSAAGTISDQTVAVVVPPRGQGEVLAALTIPGQPTRVLAQSDTTSSGASPQGGSKPAVGGKPAEGGLRIVSVEAQQGGAFFMSGVAEAGAQVRLYLNDAFVASVVGGADGHWSVKVERGMSPGAYTIRADKVDAGGQTVARAEAPFQYPAATAHANVEAKVADEPASQAALAPQNARVDELRTARVERGDSLWRISRTVYGEGLRYTQIYDANTKQIRNPRLIFPGQVLVVPEAALPDGATPRAPAR